MALIHFAFNLMPDNAATLLMKGRIHLARDEINQAVETLCRAAAILSLPEYQWTYAESLRVLGMNKEAEIVEQNILKNGFSEDPRTFALFLASNGRDAETAVQLMRDELKVRKDVFTYDAYAWVLASLGDNLEASKYSKRALIEGTQDACLFYHAGMIAAKKGNLNEAIDLLNKSKAIGLTLLSSEKRDLNQTLVALRLNQPPLLEINSI